MIIERLLMIIGIVLLVLALAAYVHRAVMVRSSIHSFEQARQQQMGNRANPASPFSNEGSESQPAETTAVPANPTSAISVVRVRATGSIPLAILRIPRIHLEAPVLHGTDDITLNRGVGQIAGTAVPGEKGNIGIAGHRDSFFRDLKDISRGDVIELETTSASTTYVVERILITGPDDTSVLQPSGEQTLTLVTCYPFHFIGPAPRRFVVQASLK